MSCNIVINQQLSSSDGSAPERKVEDPERQRRGKKSQETYMEKLKREVFKE